MPTKERAAIERNLKNPIRFNITETKSNLFTALSSWKLDLFVCLTRAFRPRWVVTLLTFHFFSFVPAEYLSIMSHVYGDIKSMCNFIQFAYKPEKISNFVSCVVS